MKMANCVACLYASFIGMGAICALAGAPGAPAVPDRIQTTDNGQPANVTLSRLRSSTLPELTLSEAPLRDVIRFIQDRYAEQRRKAGETNAVLNVVLDRSMEDRDARITLHLRNVSFHDALDMCCRVAGLGFTVQGNAVVIHAPPEKVSTGAYLVDARVTPAEGTNTCLVEFRVSRGNRDGSTTLVSCPKITAILGSEGQMEIADEDGKNGIFCTVLVKEEDKGGFSARTHVKVREGGKVVCDTAQSITLPARPVNAMPR